MLNKKMDDVCITPHFGSLFPPTVNYQVVLTDILIELTKNNKFGLKSPAIARHLIIHINIYQIGICFMENMQNLFLFYYFYFYYYF